MKGRGARRRLPLRFFIAVAAAVWAFAVVTGYGFQWHVHVPDAPHPVLASLGSEFVVDFHHHHLLDGSPHAFPERFATEVLPWSAIALVALGAIAAVVAVAVWLVPSVVVAGRGPPAGVLAGQDLLTRFCLSRR